MAGMAVATTVASSICMKSAQPTIKGIMRTAFRSRPASSEEGDDGVSDITDSNFLRLK